MIDRGTGFVVVCSQAIQNMPETFIVEELQRREEMRPVTDLRRRRVRRRPFGVVACVGAVHVAVS